MSRHSLSGGCSCGRNVYTISIPHDHDTSEIAQVFFDNSHVHRHVMASPLTSWLRVPLSWYSSSTQAFFADETAPAIRRTYTLPSQPSSLRNFCGFCGTPLSYWTESPAPEASYINLTLGSLSGKDLRELEELGLLPPEVTEDVARDQKAIETAGNEKEAGGQEDDGLGRTGVDWFETMCEGSRLERANTRRYGERRAAGARWRIEWEIVEWVEGEDDEGTASTAEAGGNGAKRKLGEVEKEDATMGGQ